MLLSLTKQSFKFIVIISSLWVGLLNAETMSDCSWLPDFPVFPETKVVVDSNTTRYVRNSCLGLAWCEIDGKRPRKSGWVYCGLNADGTCPSGGRFSADKCLNGNYPSISIPDTMSKAKDRKVNNTGNGNIVRIADCEEFDSYRPRYLVSKDKTSTIAVTNMCVLAGKCTVTFRNGQIKRNHITAVACKPKADGKCSEDMQKCWDADPQTIDYDAIVRSGEYEEVRPHGMASNH